LSISGTSVQKIQVSLKSDKNKCYEDHHAVLIISRSVILRIRNVSRKSFRENENTHFTASIFFFENRAFYEIMWKNTVDS